MNIRLDDNVRIRLDASDMAILDRNQACTKDFHLDGSHILSVVISLDETSSCRVSTNIPKTIRIGISPSDLQILTTPTHKKHGLVIGSVNVQVDIFKTSKSEHTHDGAAVHE